MLPNFEEQGGTRYKTQLDEVASAHSRIANAFRAVSGGPAKIFTPSAVSIGDDSIVWPSFPLFVDYPVKFEAQGSGSSPAGITDGVTYYVGDELTGEAIQFRDAEGTPGLLIDLTSQGVGFFAILPQPTMRVWVEAGWLFSGSAVPTEVAGQFTVVITAPVTLPRIDLIYVDATTGVVGVATGAESASPVAPALPGGKLPVALVSLLTSTTEVTQSDLTDVRGLFKTLPEGEYLLADDDATISQPGTYYITPTTLRTLTLASSLPIAASVRIINLASAVKVDVNASAGATKASFQAGALTLYPKQATPTTPAHWEILEAIRGASPSVLAYLNASLTTQDYTTLTEIILNAEVRDTNNDFDITTGRFTPRVPGLYLVTLKATINLWAPGATSSKLTMRINSGTGYGNWFSGTFHVDDADSDYGSASVVGILDMDGVDDYVSMWILIVTDNSITLESGPSDMGTNLIAHRIG